MPDLIQYDPFAAEVILKHDGDCSIYASPVCDCGALRRARRVVALDILETDETLEVQKAWVKHLAAIASLGATGAATSPSSPSGQESEMEWEPFAIAMFGIAMLVIAIFVAAALFLMWFSRGTS